MANASILTAFERMWQHIILKLSTKADTSYIEENFALKTDLDDIQLSDYYTKAEADNLLSEKTQVQIVTWEVDE